MSFLRYSHTLLQTVNFFTPYLWLIPQTYIIIHQDDVPPIHVVSNPITIDKLTGQNGGTFHNFPLMYYRIGFST